MQEGFLKFWFHIIRNLSYSMTYSISYHRITIIKHR